MTTEELAGLFDKHSDEYLKFERITNKRSPRPDLHALLVISSAIGRGQAEQAKQQQTEIDAMDREIQGKENNNGK